MSKKGPNRGWPAKRVAALVLTLALAALGVYIVWAGTGVGTLLPLGIGVALGLLYTARGGSLPDWAYRLSHRHRLRGTGITADDDPSNLPPKVYLPILLAAVAIAAALYIYFTHMRR